MRVSRAVKGSRVAMMSFDELCGSALGAADYTAISEAFHTIFVHGVPMMNLVHLNQVRRDEAGRAHGGTPPSPHEHFSFVSTSTRFYFIPSRHPSLGQIPLACSFSRPVLLLSDNTIGRYARKQSK